MADSVTVLHLAVDDVAEHLAHTSSSIFRAIRPTECLRKAWERPALRHTAPNVLAASAHFNAVSMWAQYEVVCEPEPKTRAKVLVRFMAIAERLFDLKAFSAVLSLLSAFSAAPVHRLMATNAEARKEAGARLLAKLELMQKYLSHEYNYRGALALLDRCAPPCVPYLGIFLSQLIKVEEGSADVITPATANTAVGGSSISGGNSSGGGGGAGPEVADGPRLINMAKRAKVAEIIGRIRTLQGVGSSGGYDFGPCEAVDRYFGHHVKKWEAALREAAFTGDQGYRKALEAMLDKESLKCEPRRQNTPPTTAVARATSRRGSVEPYLSGNEPKSPRRGSLP